MDRAINAVGVDAETASAGAAAQPGEEQKAQFEQERARIAPEQKPEKENWQPGHAPSQALRWAVEGLCKAGTLSIIGVYPPTAESFPSGGPSENARNQWELKSLTRSLYPGYFARPGGANSVSQHNCLAADHSHDMF